jgi:hypothetical protein
VFRPFKSACFPIVQPLHLMQQNAALLELCDRVRGKIEAEDSRSREIEAEDSHSREIDGEDSRSALF